MIFSFFLLFGKRNNSVVFYYNSIVRNADKKFRSNEMDIKSLAKGAAAGAAAGMAFCALTDASPSKKMSIKKDAGKTLKAANNLWDDIKSLMM